MRKLSYEELVAIRRSTPEAQMGPRYPIALVVHEIRSLYNVGSLFRTSDAFAVQEVVLVGYTPSPPRPEISKTALGADEVVPYIYHPTIDTAISSLRERGYQIWAAEITTESASVSNLTLENFPLALVLGNELTGVPDSVLEQCDGALEIAMYGTKHSLNVAVAAGVLLSTLVERYRELL